MIQIIKSKDNTLVKYIKKLKSNSFAKEEGRFVIEGEHLCLMAKDSLEYIFTPIELDEKIYPKQYLVTNEIMEKLSDGKSPARMIGVCLMKKPKNIDPRLALYLDDVQDPGNVGTIFRTALSFGFDTVYITDKTAFEYNSKVIQASQGAIFDLNIIHVSKDKLSELKKGGYILVSTALRDNSVFAHDFVFKKSEKYVIILGNEGKGISKDILDMSDVSLKINIKGMESLNVAIAGGIVMNQAYNSKE